MTDEQKQSEEQPEAAQADLEVSEEQAEQVEGGTIRIRIGGVDKDPKSIKPRF